MIVLNQNCTKSARYWDGCAERGTQHLRGCKEVEKTEFESVHGTQAHKCRERSHFMYRQYYWWGVHCYRCVKSTLPELKTIAFARRDQKQTDQLDVKSLFVRENGLQKVVKWRIRVIQLKVSCCLEDTAALLATIHLIEANMFSAIMIGVPLKSAIHGYSTGGAKGCTGDSEQPWRQIYPSTFLLSDYGRKMRMLHLSTMQSDNGLHWYWWIAMIFSWCV